MEIREGTIPLVSLAIVFMGLQIWWLRTTIVNGRVHKKYLAIRKAKNTLPKDQLKIQKEKLEELLKEN